ncbi:hypothetical protein YSA_00199 [Pseudomonas putida ND6]|uniref:Uncharacterized protein n=1 Tax=Pseudomonas putida ND6 TaxID=231023 RepID=I3UN11_PSEPU|nr:hypothetical protein YSA_00199 [Pseudomonas putida ND6]
MAPKRTRGAVHAINSSNGIARISFRHPVNQYAKDVQGELGSETSDRVVGFSTSMNTGQLNLVVKPLAQTSQPIWKQLCAAQINQLANCVASLWWEAGMGVRQR